MKPRYRRMIRLMKNRTGPAAAGRADASWELYILRCGDGSYYTGVTTDVDRRVREHQDGKASRYTRTHQPVVLVHKETCGSRSEALSRECAVKSLSRQDKDALVASGGRGTRPTRKKR